MEPERKLQSSSMEPFEAGSTVRLVALSGRPELNGRRGTVRGSDADSGRYAVELDGEPRPLAIRPGNLQPDPAIGRMARVVGLVERCDLNGKRGIVASFNEEQGRFCVKFAGGEETANVKPANLREEGQEGSAASDKLTSARGPASKAFCTSMVAVGDSPQPLIRRAWAPYPAPPCVATGVAVFGGENSLDHSNPNYREPVPGNALFFLELAESTSDGMCTWSRLHNGGAGCPAHRAGAGMVSLLSGLWLWGGAGENGRNDPRVWWFDGTKWSVLCEEEGQGSKSKTQGPKRGRVDFVAATLGDEVLVWGGGMGSAMADGALWSFSIRRKKWTQLHNGRRNAPPVSKLCASFVTHGALYIYGGEDEKLCSTGEFWRWDGNWRKLPNLGQHPHHLSESVGLAIEIGVPDERRSIGIVFGGYYNFGCNRDRLISDTEVAEALGPYYTEYADKVRQRDPKFWDAHRERIRIDLFEGYRDDLFAFDPVTLEWTCMPATHGLIPQAQSWAVSCKGRLFVGGGYGLVQDSELWDPFRDCRIGGSLGEQQADLSHGGYPAEGLGMCAAPVCIAAIFRVSLSLNFSPGLGTGRLGNGAHFVCSRPTVWACAPTDVSDPTFDLGWGGSHERSFFIVCQAVRGDLSTTLITDVYEGPVSSRALDVIQQLSLVHWGLLQRLGPPAVGDERKRLAVGCMLYARPMCNPPARLAPTWRDLARFVKNVANHNSTLCPRELEVSDHRADQETSAGCVTRQQSWLHARWKIATERNQNVLALLKASRRACGGDVASEMGSRQLVIDVALTQLVPPVWRRLRVSSSMRLDVFDDQVLRPVLGLPRNTHLSVFRVANGQTRAAGLGLAQLARFGEIEPMPLCFGPALVDFVLHESDDECQHTDRMHINVFYGGALCNFAKVRLSDLLCAAGDVLEWVYDLGAAHRYTLRVAELVDVAPSEDSPVRLLDGLNAPIPIDTGGIEFIAILYNSLWPLEHRRGSDTAAGAGGGGGGGRVASAGSTGATIPSELMVVEHAVEKTGAHLEPATWWENYDDLRFHCMDSALTCDFLSRYDPTFFNLATCEAALRAAASSCDGAMHTKMTLQCSYPGSEGSLALKDGGAAAQRLASSRQSEAPRCFHCGIQVGLQRCGSCKMVSFCGKACLAAGWPAHKSACKKESKRQQGKQASGKHREA